MPSARKKSIHYVDNKKLFAAMEDYIEKCNEASQADDPRPRVPEYIGACIFKIATRLATKPNFSSYTYKDEMIADGIEVCIRYLHNFNPEKSNNPFAYFTQIIYYAFLQRIQKEKKQAYVKAKSFEQSAIMNMLVDDPTGRFFDSYHAIDSDKLAEMEKSLKPKKKGDPK